MSSRSDSKSIHPLLNQKKPHPPHEVLVSKKNFYSFKIFHYIPYKLPFFKETKMQEKSHRCEEAGAHLMFIDQLWKTKKIRILEEKRIAGDIIILHMCTKNHNYMRYSSWDTKNEKMKFSKKIKKVPGSTTIYTGVPKIMIRWCTVSEIWCAKGGWTDTKKEKVTYRGECPT